MLRLLMYMKTAVSGRIWLYCLILFISFLTISRNAYACGWPEYQLTGAAQLFQFLGCVIAGLLLWMSARIIPMILGRGVNESKANFPVAILLILFLFAIVGRNQSSPSLSDKHLPPIIYHSLDPMILISLAALISLLLMCFPAARERSKRIFRLTCILSVVYGLAIYITFGSIFVPYVRHDPFHAL